LLLDSKAVFWYKTEKDSEIGFAALFSGEIILSGMIAVRWPEVGGRPRMRKYRRPGVKISVGKQEQRHWRPTNYAQQFCNESTEHCDDTGVSGGNAYG
jgi:hypothetical protein